jgi:hypothetical protein
MSALLKRFNEGGEMQIFSHAPEHDGIAAESGGIWRGKIDAKVSSGLRHVMTSDGAAFCAIGSSGILVASGNVVRNAVELVINNLPDMFRQRLAEWREGPADRSEVLTSEAARPA